MKSLLLFFILFILGNIIAGAVAVRLATNNVENVIKKQLGAVVKLEFDTNQYISEIENSQEKILERDFVTSDFLNMMGKSKYLKSFDYTSSAYLGSPEYELWKPPGIIMQDNELPFSVQVKGTSNPNILLIEQGRARLESGRTFTDDEIEDGKHIVIVSKELADLNGWTIGHEIVLENRGAPITSVRGGNVKPRPISLKIIGVLEYISPEWILPDQMIGSIDDERYDYNLIIAPNKVVVEEQKYMWETLHELPKDDNDGTKPTYETLYDAYFVLNTPDDINDFIEEYQPQLPRNYRLVTSQNIFASIEASVKQGSNLSFSILAFSIGASMCTISMVLLLFLRDRKHELGIYMALGESKRRIVAQIVIEVMIIAVLATILSLFTGQMIGKVLSDTMIEDQLMANSDFSQDEAFWQYKSQFGRLMSYASSYDVAQNYRIEFTGAYTLFFVAIGLGVVLLSTILPVIHILKFNPRRHLL